MKWDDGWMIPGNGIRAAATFMKDTILMMTLLDSEGTNRCFSGLTRCDVRSVMGV